MHTIEKIPIRRATNATEMASSAAQGVQHLIITDALGKARHIIVTSSEVYECESLEAAERSFNRECAKG